jgi:transcriptional regulator NrdR family protein
MTVYSTTAGQPMTGNDVDSCPECGHHEVDCIDSRPYSKYRRRRKKCVSCSHKFSTVEVRADDYNAIVARIRAELITKLTEML